MFARSLALSTLMISMTATCQAQELLNPFSWFGPGYRQSGYTGNCANGQCAPTSAYRGASTANCPNGNCNVGAGYAGYPSAPYSNGSGGTSAGYRGAPTANCPTGNCPLQNGGYSANRPVINQPYYSAQPRQYPTQYPTNYGPSVTNPNDYRYPAPVNRAVGSSNRNFNSSNNSPFYP